MFSQSVVTMNENADVQMQRKANVANVQRHALAEQSVNQHSIRKEIGKKVQAAEVKQEQECKKKSLSVFLDVCTRRDTDEETYENCILSREHRISEKDMKNIVYKYCNRLTPPFICDEKEQEYSEVEYPSPSISPCEVETSPILMEAPTFVVPQPAPLNSCSTDE